MVRALAVSVFVLSAGATAFVPLFPRYVLSHGGTDASVGYIMSAYFIGALIAQFGAGRSCDRYGAMRVFFGGLGVYGLGALLLLVFSSPLGDFFCRLILGVGAGASDVAAMALVAQAVPLHRRGRAFGLVMGFELAGLAVGPMAGSIAGVSQMRWLFAAAAAAAFVAPIPVLFQARRTEWEPPEPPPERRLEKLRRLGAAPRGAIVAALSIGLMGGVVNATWTLLMDHHHATAWEVGLSWSLYAVPFAFSAPLSGRLIDRMDRRKLVVIAAGWSLTVCAIYPLMPGVTPLLAMCVFEPLGWALVLPGLQSFLGEGAGPLEIGRRQGLYATCQTGANAIGGAAAGALFGIAVVLPFFLTAGLGALGVGLAAWWWRSIPGKVTKQTPDVVIDPMAASLGAHLD
jgi:MFS family permease